MGRVRRGSRGFRQIGCGKEMLNANFSHLLVGVS